MALVTVAGAALPSPSTYSGSHVDIVDNGRNAQGKMVGSVIRSNVAKVEMSWNYLTLSAWAKICSMFSGVTKHQNMVTFLDESTGGYSTAIMYVGDRKNGGAVSNGGQIIGWKDCKLSLIEV